MTWIAAHEGEARHGRPQRPCGSRPAPCRGCQGCTSRHRASVKSAKASPCVHLRPRRRSRLDTSGHTGSAAGCRPPADGHRSASAADTRRRDRHGRRTAAGDELGRRCRAVCTADTPRRAGVRGDRTGAPSVSYRDRQLADLRGIARCPRLELGAPGPFLHEASEGRNDAAAAAAGVAGVDRRHQRAEALAVELPDQGALGGVEQHQVDGDDAGLAEPPRADYSFSITETLPSLSTMATATLSMSSRPCWRAAVRTSACCMRRRRIWISTQSPSR